MELCRRHVDREPTCVTCGAMEESLFHITFECPLARRFWEEIKKLTGIKTPTLHQLTWAQDLLTTEHCDTRTAEMIICGAWSLWTGRNARNHGKLNWNAAAAARHISSMLEDFVCSGFEAHHDRAGTRGSWARPSNGWMKVNTDASFLAATGAGSTGAVLREERGVVLAAIARFYSNIADVLMAEALAARDGVILAIEQV